MHVLDLHIITQCDLQYALHRLQPATSDLLSRMDFLKCRPVIMWGGGSLVQIVGGCMLHG